MASTWYNDDGLRVPFGQDQARETEGIMARTWSVGPISYMVVDVNFDNLPTYTADLNNDGTNEAFDDSVPYIPVGSYITRAILVTETAWADGTSLTLGLYNQAGSVIDADGIDVAIAAAALAADTAVDCNGLLVGTQDLVTADAYLVCTVAGTFTAGKSKLVIEYIPVTV